MFAKPLLCRLIEFLNDYFNTIFMRFQEIEELKL